MINLVEKGACHRTAIIDSIFHITKEFRTDSVTSRWIDGNGIRKFQWLWFHSIRNLHILELWLEDKGMRISIRSSHLLRYFTMASIGLGLK